MKLFVDNFAFLTEVGPREGAETNSVVLPVFDLCRELKIVRRGLLSGYPRVEFVGADRLME